MSNPLNIHRHVWEPASGPASRTLLLLHGTGGDENDLLGLGRQIDPKANLLSPRGNVLENGMPRFFRRLSEGVFDLDDLRVRVADLATWLDVAVPHYAIDRASLYAVGYSNGANTAASLMLLKPGAIAGGVLMRSMLPLEPATRPELAGTRVLMLTGASDPIVPPASAAKLDTLLSSSGAAVEHHKMDAGHNLTRKDLALATEWFGRLA